MSLHPDEIQFFRQFGYLVLEEKLETSLVEELKAQINQQIHDEVEPVQRNPRGQVNRLSNLWQRGETFQRALSAAPVVAALTSLLGPDVEICTNRHNHATTRLNPDQTGIEYHRDSKQWSRSVVTVIFYLEPTHLDNGCTWIVPGSHLLQHSFHTHEHNTFTGSESPLFRQSLPVPMPAGGLLVIDGTLVHGPGINHSEHTRLSMTAGYHSSDELLENPSDKNALIAGTKAYAGNDRI